MVVVLLPETVGFAVQLGRRLYSVGQSRPVEREGDASRGISTASRRCSTQYARLDDGVVILVARPETKTWWRNFRSDRDLDVLLQGRWTPMTARAIVGADEPGAIAPLIDAYLARFPRASRALGEGAPAERARRAIVVWCRPR